MNTSTLALLDSYKAKRLGGGLADPVLTSEAVVSRFRRENPAAAKAMADDLRTNLSDYSDETGLPPDALGRIANNLAS